MKDMTVKAWVHSLEASFLVMVLLFTSSCSKERKNLQLDTLPSTTQAVFPEKPETVTQPAISENNTRLPSTILDQYLIPKEQRVAATDFQLPTLDGDPIRLTSLKGTIVLLDFSTTWCAWCTTQEPHLEKLYEEYRKRSFEILSIFCKENKQTVLNKYPSGKHIYPILLDDNGFVSSNQYGVQGYPYYLLIDKQGNIAYYQRGYEDKMYDIVSQLIEQLNIESE